MKEENNKRKEIESASDLRLSQEIKQTGRTQESVER
jgi:hypothetical protein